ncbi:hypothetical protein GCM10009547_47180 [Sporichthya brevicatena]|uniref:FlgD/Vpr Ig-like domain-containing protein n=1 Tax=Sporichthya brevicatena TaxID=171442 RepID=A0ABN1HBX6_9ACTN
MAALAALAVLAPQPAGWATGRPETGERVTTPGAAAPLAALEKALESPDVTTQDVEEPEVELPPTTVPAFVEPVGGSSLRGDIRVRVSSTAPAVQFFLNGAAYGARVPVVDGHATTTWRSWGYQGSQTFGAADCTTSGLCATDSAGTAITVTPSVPKLTAPTGLNSGPITMTASAPGGTVKFLIDGKVRGLDATAPYSIVVNDSLNDGSHTAEAIICAAGGAPCSTVDRTKATFSTKSLHPKLSSKKPLAISPNGDGLADQATVTLKLESKQKASWSLVRSNGSTAAGPFSLGTLKAGRHQIVLPEKPRSRKLPDGVFSFVVRTSAPAGAVTLVGTASTPIRIDTTRPKLTGSTGGGTTFYPVKDGYRDTFTPGGIASEKAKLTLEIASTKKTVLRSIAKQVAGGTYSFSWDGRDKSRKPVAPGAYVYRVTAVDPLGNVSISGWKRVTVSNQKLVTKTKTITMDGIDASQYGGSDPYCGWGTTSQSYSAGLLLMNACDPYYFDLTAGFWRFQLPSAISYDRLSLSVSGDSVWVPTPLSGGFENPTTGEWHILDGSTVWAKGLRTHQLGSVPAKNFVSGRTVEAAVSISNTLGGGPWDFDVRDVRLTVAYRVLN